MQLLSTGINCTEREVTYYAERLNVSPMYLPDTVKRVTGHFVLHKDVNKFLIVIKSRQKKPSGTSEIQQMKCDKNSTLKERINTKEECDENDTLSERVDV